MNDYTPSAELIEAVKNFEGGSLTPYKDPVGYWTIGYGHRIFPGGAIPELITMKQAEDCLMSDLEMMGRAVSGFVKVPLTQHQWDALTDFCYNLGASRLQSSTLLKMVNVQNWPAAQEEIKQWCHAGSSVMEGLVKRRAWEAERLDPNFGA